MIAQMVVDIRDQNIENHAPIEGLGVSLSLSTVSCKGVHDFRVTPAFSVSGAHHRHCGQERNTCDTVTVETLREKDRLARDMDQFVSWGSNASLSGQSQGDLLPGGEFEKLLFLFSCSGNINGL